METRYQLARRDAPPAGPGARCRVSCPVVRLVPVLIALTLGLFVFQATGALRLLASPECTQGCLDDDTQGRCADTCGDCSCCHHPRPIARLALPLPVAPAGLPVARHEAPPAYASAPPAEILHVPIADLA